MEFFFSQVFFFPPSLSYSSRVRTGKKREKIKVEDDRQTFRPQDLPISFFPPLSRRKIFSSFSSPPAAVCGALRRAEKGNVRLRCASFSSRVIDLLPLQGRRDKDKRDDRAVEKLRSFMFRVLSLFSLVQRTNTVKESGRGSGSSFYFFFLPFPSFLFLPSPYVDLDKVVIT